MNKKELNAALMYIDYIIQKGKVMLNFTPDFISLKSMSEWFIDNNFDVSFDDLRDLTQKCYFDKGDEKYFININYLRKIVFEELVKKSNLSSFL